MNSILQVRDSATGEWIDIPAIVGPQGEPGQSGVYLGKEEPTDENVNIWIRDVNNSDNVLNFVSCTSQTLTPEQQAQARENIAAIEAPETAEVGQTIVVKEVNENGKPTAWEAADLPTEGSGGSQNFSTVLTSDAAYRMITVPLPVNLGKALIFNVHITFPSVQTEFALIAVSGSCYMVLASKIPVNSKEVGANLYAVRHTENIYNSGTTIGKDYTYTAIPKLDTAGWLTRSYMDNTLSIYSNTDGVDLPAGTKIEVWGICE